MHTWLRLLPAVSTAALLAGCATSNPYDDAVAAKLAEIDAKLGKIVEKQTPQPAKPGSPAEREFRKADREALAKIKPLPEKPTKAEVAAYAKTIFDLSAKQNSFSSDDPQYAMIKRIGPGFAVVLTPYLDNYYFRKCLPDLVTPQDRAEVLRSLPDQPQLMTLLPYVGLEPEADVKKAILEAARKNTGGEIRFPIYPYFPMLSEDPQVWAELVELSYTKPFLWPVFYKSLKGLNPAARREKIKKIWEGQKDLPAANPWQRYKLLETVALAGVSEALEQLLDLPANILTHQQRALIRLLPDASAVPPKEMSAWYRSHRNQLRFDPAAHCYRLDSTNH